ncbi:MAG: CdaR family protein [Eubacteriales bacterium]|nr:CdaR family protein [Eubacteriales bacterium]
MEKINANTKNSDQIVLPPMKKQHIYSYIVFIGAFLGAFLLWFYAIGYDSTIFERRITDVPVKITGVEALTSSKGFTVADELDITITVTVSGKRSIIYSIDSSSLTATVDISQVEQPGENTLPIKVTAPNGINVENQTSKEVILFIDEFITKTIAVKANYISYVLSEGLLLEDPEVNPAVVSVEGPKSELEKIDSAFVDLILGDITGPISAAGKIYLKNRDGVPVVNGYIKLNKNEAYVSIPVKKEKTVPVKVELTGGVFSTEDAVISLTQESVKIYGEIELIDSIEKIVIPIDERTFDFRNTIRVTKYMSSLLPAGVDNVNGDVSITAVIGIPGLTKKNIYIKAGDIAVLQLEGNPQVTVKSGITFCVIGFRDVIRELDSSDITASIDAAAVSVDSEGKKTAEIVFGFSDDITGVYVYGTYEVEVKN